MEIIVACVVGILVGAAAGWFAALSRSKAPTDAGAVQQIAVLEAQIASERGATANQLAQQRAASQQQIDVIVTAERQRVEETRTALTSQFNAELAAARIASQTQAQSFDTRLSEAKEAAEKQLGETKASYEKQLAEGKAHHANQLSELRSSHAERITELRTGMTKDFEALSSKVLTESTKALLDRADERFKRAQQTSDAELAKREEAVRQLVKPIEKTLTEVRERVETAETARSNAHTLMQSHLEDMKKSNKELTSETHKLASAMRHSGSSGRWGELQLRRIIEASGMLPHISFEEQFSVDTDDGKLRPDLVVHLPGDKDIVIDSKVSIQDYLESLDMATDVDRNKKLDAHAKNVRNHVNGLADKAYWDLLPTTPEFVVMFLPAEPFLQVALERDPELLEHAMTRNIVVATPATLLAVLRTISYTWRQEQLAKEAQAVLAAGKELHKRLGTMGGHLATLGNRLNSAVTAYNQLNSSIDRNVVTQAKKLSALQLLDDNLAENPPLEILAVPVQKPDLYEPGTEAGFRPITGS